MLIFHGDHLVPPRLGEIVYASVDNNSHISLLFLSGTLTKGTERLGSYFPGEPRHSEIYLGPIIESALRGGEIEIGAPSFRLWYELLHVSFHELAHAEDCYLHALPGGAYAAGGNERDNVEEIANRSADLMIS